MMGRQDAKAFYKGEKMSMPEVIRRSGMTPVTFHAKEALAVVNAASFASSLAALLLFDASAAVLLTQAATALTVESLRGRVESFHPSIHRSMVHEGQLEVASNLRKILFQSKLAEHSMDMDLSDREGLLKQDRYALRTAAQWLSPTMDTLTRALKSVSIDLNSACDNPWSTIARASSCTAATSKAPKLQSLWTRCGSRCSSAANCCLRSSQRSSTSR
jgi:phenylalanine ammonia-lyase